MLDSGRRNRPATLTVCLRRMCSPHLTGRADSAASGGLRGKKKTRQKHWYSPDWIKRKICLSVSYNSSKGQTFTLCCIYMKSLLFPKWVSLCPKPWQLNTRLLLLLAVAQIYGRVLGRKGKDMYILRGWKQKPINQTGLNYLKLVENVELIGRWRTVCAVDWEFPECKVAEREKVASLNALSSPAYSSQAGSSSFGCHTDDTLSLPLPTCEGPPRISTAPPLPETSQRWG